jgi:hypothetical protein
MTDTPKPDATRAKPAIEPTVGAAVDAMMTELEHDPRFLPSAFWRDINAKNIDMIASEGLRNFKRTVSQNYYNWLITRVRDPQFRKALLFWSWHPTLRPLTTRIEPDIRLRFTTTADTVTLTTFQRWKYALFTALVWEQMRGHDHLGLASVLSEPELGNPMKIRQAGRLITQDLANSIVEGNIIADTLGGTAKPRVAEVGAGNPGVIGCCRRQVRPAPSVEE